MVTKAHKAAKKRPVAGPKSEAPAETPTLDSIVACPRCSLFLAGYRLAHHDADEALGKARNGWLTLTWSQATRELTHKAFGGRIDLDAYHFEGICQECRRPFVFTAAGAEGQPIEPTLSLKLRP